MLAAELSDEIGGSLVDASTLEHAHTSWRGHYAGMMLSDRVPEDTQCSEESSQVFDIASRPLFLDDNTEDGVKEVERGLKVLSRWCILYYHRTTLILPKGSCFGADE